MNEQKIEQALEMARCADFSAGPFPVERARRVGKLCGMTMQLGIMFFGLAAIALTPS